MKQATAWQKASLTICTILAIASAIAAGVFTNTQDSQNKPKPVRTYKPERIVTAPKVVSKIKDLEIAGVSLVNQGTKEAALSIDVINNRDHVVMVLDFSSGKSDYSALSFDGLLEEGHSVVIIPPHTLKTFTWFVGEIIENETVFLAAAIFADGKEEGDKRSLDGIKVHRRNFQQKQRDAKAKNGI